MTTAAEALVRDCANRLDQLFRQDYTMREVEAELRRLLRAALAPPQAAPVQEPVRYTMWSTSDGYVNPRADPEGAWVLYAAPPQDEAVALLREAYNELIVDPEQDEATRAVGDALVERIRAFLKDRT